MLVRTEMQMQIQIKINSYRVEGDGRVARLGSVHAREVGVYQTKYALVPDDQHRFLVALQLLYQRVEAGYDVQVGFPARVPVAQLVFCKS